MTRRHILASARQLFAVRGYGATTLTEVAAEAGVAVQTVYAVFKSKAGILRALRETVMRDPDADGLFEQAVDAGRLEAKLGLFARSIRLRWEHGHDVVAVHRDAGRTDVSIARDVGRTNEVRRRGIETLARSFAGKDTARCVAILHALTLPEIYEQLVHVERWSPDEYERWLAGALTSQLRGSGVPGGRAG